MSLFDSVKKWPANPGLDLFVELKYGKPQPTTEYVEKLPLTVVREAHCKFFNRPYQEPGETREEVLRDNLRALLNREEYVKLTIDLLVKYHTLLGSM